MTWNELVKFAIPLGYERYKGGITKKYSNDFVFTIQKTDSVFKAYETILFLEGERK